MYFYMTLTHSIKSLFRKAMGKDDVLSPAQAYDLWAADYDNQPHNLMLQLDKRLVEQLLTSVSFENKQVVDMGCGTGRHWPLLLSRQPKNLIGFDVSAGMLSQLHEKYPQATTMLIREEEEEYLSDGEVDFLISTLTIAHIRNLEKALDAWQRMLGINGEMIITDFHPSLLTAGGKRTFRVDDKTLTVENHAHSIDRIINLLESKKFRLVQSIEIKIDDSLRHHYETQQALHVYEKYKGQPVIYGMHFQKKM